MRFAYKLRQDIESEVKKIMNDNQKDKGIDEVSVNEVKSSGYNKLCHYVKKFIWLFIGAMIITSTIFFYKTQMSKDEINYKKEAVSDASSRTENEKTVKSDGDKIYENDNTKKEAKDSLETNEKSVSTFAPGKESGGESKTSVNSKVEFYSSDKVGYKLVVTDAASGSRFYILKGTSDGGATWTVINEDPFGGNIGVAEGITFLNEKLGFLCLSHSGESYGELYRTEDGGLSYKKVDFESIKVTLKDGESYEPFAMPEMPYKENESLKVLIGQGVNGDYNGGSKALYESKNEGKTWTYVKEMTREQFIWGKR